MPAYAVCSSTGTGADRQRAAYARRASTYDVLAAAVDWTGES